MQPTLDADLRAAKSAIERLLVTEPLSGEIVAGLGEVTRTLTRAERSWARMLPALVAENRTISTLLDEISAAAPEISDPAPELGGATTDPLREFDAAAVNEHNAQLRTMLAAAIQHIPVSEDGTAMRLKIRAGLLDALALRPW